jgi:integrase
MWSTVDKLRRRVEASEHPRPTRSKWEAALGVYAASWMVRVGVPLAKIQAILGHAGIQTTLKYAHLMPEHLSDSMAALDAAVGTVDDLDT